MSIKKKLVTAVTTAGLLAGLFGSAFVPAARAVAFETGADSLLNCTRVSDTANCAQISGGTARISFPALVASNGAGAAGDDYLQTDTDGDGDEADEGAVNNTTVLGMDDTLIHYILIDGADPERITNGDNDITIGADLDDDADEARMEVTFALADNDVVAADGNYFEVSSDDGDVTITLGYYSATGLWTVLQTETVTFDDVLDDDAVDFSSADTFVGLTDDSADCDEVDNNAAADALVEEIAYPSDDNTDAFYVCVQLYTNDEGALGANQNDNVTVEITDSTGKLNVGNDGSNFEDTMGDMDAANIADASLALDADDGDVAIIVESEDDDVEPFEGTLTVEITQEDDDLGIAVSATYTFSVIGTGDLATITLEVVQLSTDDDAAAVDVIEYTGADANGNSVAVDAAAAAADLIIDSDISDTATIDEVGEEDAAATVANQADATASTPGDLRLTCSNGNFEAIEITLEVTVGDDEITSNTVTVYCAEATVDSMTLSVDDSTPAPGESIEVTAVALDENGYPVPDAEVITFSAAQGAWTDTTVEHELGESVGTYVAGQGGTVILIATGDAVVETISIMVASDITLTRGSKKRVATADLGATYANVKVVFTVERASTGAVSTYYRKANASGVATFRLKKNGRFEVTASYGDSISNSVILKK